MENLGIVGIVLLVVVSGLMMALCTRDRVEPPEEDFGPDDEDTIPDEYPLDVDDVQDPYAVGSYQPGNKRRGYLPNLGFMKCPFNNDNLMKDGFQLQTNHDKYDWLIPIAVLNNAPDLLVDPNMMFIFQLVILKTWRMANEHLAITFGMFAETRPKMLVFDETVLGDENALICPPWMAGEVGDQGWADLPNDPSATPGEIVVFADPTHYIPTRSRVGFVISGPVSIAAASFRQSRRTRPNLVLQTTRDPPGRAPLVFEIPADPGQAPSPYRVMCIDPGSDPSYYGPLKMDEAGFNRELLIKNLGLKIGPLFHVMAADSRATAGGASLKLADSTGASDRVTGVDLAGGAQTNTRAAAILFDDEVIPVGGAVLPAGADADELIGGDGVDTGNLTASVSGQDGTSGAVGSRSRLTADIESSGDQAVAPGGEGAGTRSRLGASGQDDPSFYGAGAQGGEGASTRSRLGASGQDDPSFYGAGEDASRNASRLSLDVLGRPGSARDPGSGRSNASKARDWWEDGRRIGKAHAPLRLAGGSIMGGTRDLFDGVVDLPERYDPLLVPDEYSMVVIEGGKRVGRRGLVLSHGVGIFVRPREVKAKPQPKAAAPPLRQPPPAPAAPPVRQPAPAPAQVAPVSAAATSAAARELGVGLLADEGDDVLAAPAPTPAAGSSAGVTSLSSLQDDDEDDNAHAWRSPNPTFAAGPPPTRGRIIQPSQSGLQTAGGAPPPSGASPVPPQAAATRVPNVQSLASVPQAARPTVKTSISPSSSKVQLPGQLRAPPGKKEFTLGSFEAQAGSESEFTVSLDIPVEMRAQAKVTVESPGGVIQIARQRGRGDKMDLDMRAIPKRSGNVTFKVKVESGGKVYEAQGTVNVARPPPADLAVRSVIGFPSSHDVPMPELLPNEAKYEAFLDPPSPELRLSARRGVIPEGADLLPCKLIFAPLNSKGALTTLVVIIDEVEYCYRVIGSVAGFGRGRWGEGAPVRTGVGAA